MFIFKAAPRVTRHQMFKKTDPKAAETMRRLNEFLKSNSPELAEWLVHTWEEQRNIFTYKDLREAALNGYEAQIRQWQENYTEAINRELAPMIERALLVGAASQIVVIGREVIFDSSDRQVKEWLRTRTGELITNMGEETRKAVQTIVGKSQIEQWSSDKLGRMIRASVGLNRPQAIANANYQNTVQQKLLEDNPRMTEATAAAKAHEAALKYAGQQHRYRAQMIADTELAFAYNQGAYESVRQAMRQGLMGPTIKIWSTARDERTCPTCGSLNGVSLGFDDSWNGCKDANGTTVKWSSKGSSRIPPAHPNCRCTVRYEETAAPKFKKPVMKPQEGGDEGLMNPANGAIMVSNVNVFIPAKTLTEAEDFARNTIGIQRVSYKGHDVETANDWNRGLFETFRQFPELKKNFGFVGDCRERNRALKTELIAYYDQEIKARLSGASEATRRTLRDKKVAGVMNRMKVSKRAFAQSMSSTAQVQKAFNGVTVNSDWGKDADNFKKELERCEQSKFHPKGCVTIRSVLDHEIGHQLDDLLDLRSLPEIKELFDKRKHKQITDDLSEYSWNNGNPNRYGEFIAEAWSEFCNTKPPRREIAQKVGEIAIREYTKKFGGTQP